MNRDIFRDLVTWKNSSRRKPLILRGARQVGKTHALLWLAKNHYADYVHFNFDKDKMLKSFFAQGSDPKKVIESLSVHRKKKIEPHKTLIIFDEIQECNSALNSLKYFNEEANDYHIVSAGSLLGVKLSTGKSFPVGKVNFLNLYPMTFLEFLEANQCQELKNLILNKEDFEPIPEAFHFELIEYLKKYFIIGGMPEVVSEYISSKNLNVVREVQREILETYDLDFSKHAPLGEVIRITSIWKSIPTQLAKENKKFIFSAVRVTARSREYEIALQWLDSIGLIYKSYNIETAKLPISGYRNNHIFKVYILDVGLLGVMSEVEIEWILKGDRLFTEYKGSITENYVAQSLAAKLKSDLHYWTSQGKAEVDFLFVSNNKVYPLEVKSGVNIQSKSLKVFGSQYKHTLLTRISLQNYSSSKGFCNYPLYAIDRVGKR